MNVSATHDCHDRTGRSNTHLQNVRVWIRLRTLSTEREVAQQLSKGVILCLDNTSMLCDGAS